MSNRTRRAGVRYPEGGRQLPLLQEPPDSGCFRWGMCDPPKRDGEE